MVADQKGITVGEVRAALLKTERPVFRGTIPDDVRFDKGERNNSPRTGTPVKKRRPFLLPANPDVPPPDNGQMWKLFGAHCPAGRSLKNLYYREPPSPRGLVQLAATGRTEEGRNLLNSSSLPDIGVNFWSRPAVQVGKARLSLQAIPLPRASRLDRPAFP